MKPRHTLFAARSRQFLQVLTCGSLAATPLAASGATIGKADNTNDLNLTTSWSGGTVPGALDIGSWSGLGGANSTALGANLSLGGITIGTTGGEVAITGANTLTLGSGGIDMSAASQNLTLSSSLALAQGAQTWKVATGRTLTLNTGTFTRATGAILLIDRATQTGTVSASPTLTNGVLPWAIVNSGGTAANNSANGYTFATVSGGNLVPYTAATAVTTSYPATNSATNYDWSSSGTQAQIGSSRAANTIRYTGSGVTQTTNSTQTQTFNALMNAGTGTVTLGGGSIMNIQSATGELVLAPMTADITINGPIINNGATAGAVTITGGSSARTVTLGGSSTFTGNLTINSGTLAVGTGQGASPTASNLGALQPAANRNITINSGAILSFTGGNVLGTGGSTNTLANTSLVVNSGGILQSGLNGSGAGWWNKIGATTLDGGTIRVGSGANATVFQGLALIGTVTVTGNSAASIENHASSNSTSNGVHLGQNSTASQSITFNVADVTASASSDLNVSTRLLNTSANLTASGLTKTGLGTMTLTAANEYTGPTTISQGTLQIGAGGTAGSIAAAGAVSISNGAALVINRSDAITLSNSISGSGSLAKNGAGTLTLSGTSTHSGPISVNTGTLKVTGSLASNVSVASGATFAGTGSTTGSLSLAGGSTLSVDTGAEFSSNGVDFAGQTNLLFSGSFSSGNTYDVITYGAGGVTNLANLIQTSRGSLVNDTVNSKVTFTAGSVLTGTWSAPAGTWDVGVSALWSNGSDSRFWNGDTVVFDDTPGVDSSVTISGTVVPAAVTVSGSTNHLFGGTGSIGGTAGLSKSGSGVLTVQTANTYSGATTVDAGTLVLEGSLAGSAVTVGSGGTFSQSGSGAISGAVAFTTAGLATLAGANTYNGGTALTGGTLAVNHASALGSGAVTVEGGTLDNTSGGAIVVSTNNVQNWNGDFTFTGSGNLDLGTGAVTVGGSGTRVVTVGAGTLAAGELKTGVGQGFTKQGGGTLLLSSDGAGVAASVIGGALDLAGGTLQMNRAAGNSGDLTAAGLTGSGTLSNGAAVERWFFANAASGTFEFSGSLVNGAAGGLGFNKSGASTQILSGANSYTGITTVAGGDLVIRGANSGAGTNVTLTGTGLGLVLGHESALGAASLINVSGGTSNATLRYATDAAGTAYDLSMSSGATLNVVLDRSTSGTSVTHNLSTATAGSGLGSGTVNVSRGSNVSGLATASFDTFNLGGGLGGTTVLAPAEGTQVSIGSVSKSNNAAAQTLGLAGSTTGNSISGAISNGVGTISVSKSGSSVWTLSGASTYTGTTAVNAGRLVVDGTIASSSLTTVAAGAILGGSGTLGATTVAGTHAPGNSPGVQTVAGNLTYSAGSNFVWELIANSTSGRGSDFDGITLTGASNLVFAGATTLDLDFALAGSAVNWSDTLWSQSVSGINGWKVFDLDTGAITGLENLAIGGSDWLDGNGGTLSVIRPGAAFSLFQDGNDLYLNYTYVSAIPEPGSLLGLGLLIGAPVLMRRRK
jgi:fibronectin-binding autotransporter adhesin